MSKNYYHDSSVPSGVTGVTKIEGLLQCPAPRCGSQRVFFRNCIVSSLNLTRKHHKGWIRVTQRHPEREVTVDLTMICDRGHLSYFTVQFSGNRAKFSLLSSDLIAIEPRESEPIEDEPIEDQPDESVPDEDDDLVP